MTPIGTTPRRCCTMGSDRMTDDEKKEGSATNQEDSAKWVSVTTPKLDSVFRQPILSPAGESESSQRLKRIKHQKKLERAIQELKRDSKKKKFAEIKARRRGSRKIGSKPKR